MKPTSVSRVRVAAVACTAVLLLGATTPAFAYPADALSVNTDTLAQVAAQQFTESADIMVAGLHSRPTIDSLLDRHATTFDANHKRFEKAVDNYRKKLAAMGETYSASHSTTTIDSIRKQPNGTVEAIATETTYLTIAGAGTETGYTARHQLTFAPSANGKWEIVEDKYLEPTGLLPLDEAESLVDPTSDYFKAEKSDSNPDFTGVTPASIERTTDSALSEKATVMAGGYNYNAMANYLERYWSKYNPAYRSFHQKGGDCTNFVSQALRAGGWKDKYGWPRNANYWWYGFATQSRSWTSVDYWATFARASGRTKNLSNVWHLRKGDVLQVTKKKSNQKIHTMMVSYYHKGVPYFTYHTADRYRRSLKQVLIDWKGATFYAYRT
ncbi:amidase domain-containing protein [Boudabousia marimammalium]|uniref:Putative amidase domain-containing protein n=1 Tax=Boudabousia marimammalium TaxID=156892 RepID=A0A1Q5PJY6_9ACTO|nr:amidase domain-containing protein [Boudabousia marimammalium]OKL46245.1 hypothetical protein BM477_07390 [Boudabousia marimammalium]